MEVAIGSALSSFSTQYRSLPAATLEELAHQAERCGMDAQAFASMFDKFMSVHRFGSSKVSVEDVEAFAKSASYARALAKRTSFGLENHALNIPAAAPTKELAAPQSSQRLSPHLVRTSPRVSELGSPLPNGSERARRQSAGAVVVSFNEHLAIDCGRSQAAQQPSANASGSGASAPETPLSLLRPGPAPDARILADTLEERASYLELCIQRAEQRVSAALSNDPREEGAAPAREEGELLRPVGVVSQQDAIFVGRIAKDLEDARLSPQSVFLEGSAGLSHGARVRLDLSACARFRIFPGQVVAVYGSSPSGHCIAARALSGGEGAGPDQSLPAWAAAALGALASGGPPPELAPLARPARVLLAAGPFTAPDSLGFELLADLERVCRDGGSVPDAVVLQGPFVPEAHALLPGMQASFEELFARRVGAFVASLRALGCAVALQPAVSDALALPVFPQPALTQTGASLALPNPATFALPELGGLALGASSADWLLACSREECAGGPAPQADRLASLAQHVLDQGRFMPLFPPPRETPLDCGLARAHAALPCTPHLLVLPSNLAPCVRALRGGCLCINPGRLARGNLGGTYAEVRVAPGRGSVQERCRVDILRI